MKTNSLHRPQLPLDEFQFLNQHTFLKIEHAFCLNRDFLWGYSDVLWLRLIPKSYSIIYQFYDFRLFDYSHLMDYIYVWQFWVCYKIFYFVPPTEFLYFNDSLVDLLNHHKHGDKDENLDEENYEEECFYSSVWVGVVIHSQNPLKNL